MSGTMRSALIELMLTMSPVSRCTIGGQQRARHAHQADQVGLDDGGPVVGRAQVEAGAAADVVAGVVDEHVDAPPVGRKVLEDAVDGGLVGDIERQRQGGVAKVGQFANRIGIAVGQDDAMAGLQEGLADGAAHPAGGAGNQGNLWRAGRSSWRRFPLVRLPRLARGFAQFCQMRHACSAPTFVISVMTAAD